MNEEVIVKVRRSRQYVSNCQIQRLFMVLPHGRFFFFGNLCDEINFQEGDGLMFAFNINGGRAWLQIEKEQDSFYPKSKKGENVKRFTSKDLMEYFINVFNLLDFGEKKFEFIVNETFEEGKGYQLLHFKK